jgi:hypothetical protein
MLTKHSIARAVQDEYTALPGRAFDAKSDALVAAAYIALADKQWIRTTVGRVSSALLKERKLVLDTSRDKAGEYICPLIRDIFSNPFRPAALDPHWLTSTVVDLAQDIYQERVFERMPILADALMDSGCNSEEIISHCQGDGPHVRGCWVIDLILGKE